MATLNQQAADRWNQKLVFFRFQFAHGGHANDMDILSASIRFVAGETGLLDCMNRLGVILQRITPKMRQREPGRSYNSSEWGEYVDVIPAYPQFVSPGFTSIDGKPVNLSILSERIHIMVSGAKGNAWVVDEADFRNASALEVWLPARGIEFVRVASRLQAEQLFEQLRLRGLPDLKTHSHTQQNFASMYAANPDIKEALEAYDIIRRQLGPDFADNEIWNDAHEQIFALVSSARHYHANPIYVAHRCPGFSPAVIERVCAEVKSSLR